MPDIIFIPGLGADERLFKFIETGNCKKHFVKWMKPDADESLQSYVQKIKDQVSSSAELPVLVGVSLGGIIAMELREMMPVKKTILIASVKNKTEMPGYFNWINKIRLNEMVPPSVLKRGSLWIRPFINGTSDSTFGIFKEMLFDTDDAFISWGIRKVLQWERTSFGESNLVHIHGTRDLVFPIRNITNCDYKIKDGPHNIVMHKAAEINEILAKEIPG